MDETPADVGINTRLDIEVKNKWSGAQMKQKVAESK